MRPQKLANLKEVHKSLEAILTDSEPNALRDYITDSESYFSDYQSVSSFKELVEDCISSDIVYISDYHLLNLAQEGALNLLNKFVEQGKQFTLCLETVMEKHQPWIDAYLKEKISEKKFLKEINYKNNWPFEWKNFKPFFDFARDNKIEIKGIDCCRGNRSNPDKTKEILAKRIAKHASDKSLVVIVGESHLCPTHIPASVDSILDKRGKKRSRTIVLQDNRNIYWRLAERNLEDTVEVTKLQEDTYNITNTTPLIRAREYLFFQLDADNTFHNDLCIVRDGIIEDIINEIGLPKIKKKDYPKLFTSLNHLETAGIGREKIKTFEAKAECCYEIKDNIIYFLEFSEEEMVHECTHFINSHFNKGSQWMGNQTNVLNLFYTHCISEAMAHFGTKIIDPNYTFDDEEYKQEKAYLLFEKHIRCEKNYKKRLRASEIYPFEIFRESKETISMVFHLLGYRLGKEIYSAFQEGDFSKKEVRELLFKSFESERSAMETYFSLVDRLT